MKRKSKRETDQESRKRAKQSGTEYRIRKYSKLRSDVPLELRGQFNTMLVLGNMQFEEYRNSLEQPWQREIKKKALRISAMAARCREDRQNEAGWREIESKLFERFDIEVACKRCRKRLWRSEIEVDPSNSNGRTTSLADRQKKRVACTCDDLQWGDDYDFMDPGLSNLFGSRLDMAADGSDAPVSERRKRPDRLHGLRRTLNFDTALQSPYAYNDSPSQNLVEDTIQTSLHDDGDASLLYPFLIVEAKSEKGNDGFGDMELQTCVPIQRALKLQWQLLEAPGNTMGLPSGPLIWFLAYRGEDWRLYAGHAEHKGEGPKFFVNHLWSGCITGENESLQLLLMIDYIMDWARDIFRPNILRQLKSLTSNVFDDRATVDPDNASQNGEEIERWMPETCEDDIAFEEPRSPPQLLLMGQTPEDTHDTAIDQFEQQFRTVHGLVKNGRRIISRLSGLLIKRENLEALLESFGTPEASQLFARKVFRLLQSQSVALDGERALHAVEERWKGDQPTRSARSSNTSVIYAQFRVSFYINPAWEIFRELAYLAVEGDAIKYLVERAAYKRGGAFSPPKCKQGRLIAALDSILDTSAQHDFLSALSRRSYILGFGEPSTVIVITEDNLPQEIQEAQPIFQQAKDIKNERLGIIMQSVVRMVFKNIRTQAADHVTSDRQLLEPFLRDSSHVVSEEKPLWQLGDRALQDQKTFLVYSDVPSAKHLPDLARRKYCLYIMHDGPMNMSEYFVAYKLLCSVYRRETYSTVRRAKAPMKGKLKDWRDKLDDFLRPHIGPITENRTPMPELQFRREICEWVKALSQPTGQESGDLRTLLSSWVFSPGAVACMKCRRYNTREKTWTTSYDASRVHTYFKRDGSPQGNVEVTLRAAEDERSISATAQPIRIAQR